MDSVRLLVTFGGCRTLLNRPAAQHVLERFRFSVVQMTTDALPSILVDTLGLLLHAVVHPADIQDRDGGVLLLSTLFGMYPFLAKLFADAGYQGPQFATAVAQILPHLGIEIVKRSDQANGFVVLPMRWVVERTLAWLNRCRRLAKDFENLSRTALAFLQLASIRLMLRKLCNPV